MIAESIPSAKRGITIFAFVPFIVLHVQYIKIHLSFLSWIACMNEWQLKSNDSRFLSILLFRILFSLFVNVLDGGSRPWHWFTAGLKRIFKWLPLHYGVSFVGSRARSTSCLADRRRRQPPPSHWPTIQTFICDKNNIFNRLLSRLVYHLLISTFNIDGLVWYRLLDKLKGGWVDYRG